MFFNGGELYGQNQLRENVNTYVWNFTVQDALESHNSFAYEYPDRTWQTTLHPCPNKLHHRSSPLAVITNTTFNGDNGARLILHQSDSGL